MQSASIAALRAARLQCKPFSRGIKRGILSFVKENGPLLIPQEKIYIAGLQLEELHALRNRVRCTWLRHESLRLVTSRNRALLS